MVTCSKPKLAGIPVTEREQGRWPRGGGRRRLVTWLQLIGRSAIDTVTTVTVPVGVLLWLLAWLEVSGRFRPSRVLGRAGRWQPLYSAAIAAVPGCAGGIAVSRLYAEGVIGSAALWAAHIATGGDAAFVLLVGRPLTALSILAFLFVFGTAVGMLTARGEGVAPKGYADLIAGAEEIGGGRGEGGTLPRLYAAWLVLVVAAALAALAGSRLGPYATLVAGLLGAGAVGASIAIQRTGSEAPPPPPGASGRAAALIAARDAVKDAAEITLWVAVADFAFYAVEHLWGIQVQNWLNGAVLPVTLIAAAVGMIPGCGPQIFLARLFTAGSLPFPAILANSVSQHGDSLFPLLSSRARDALRVTVASALLAAAVGLIWAGAGPRLLG